MQREEGIYRVYLAVRSSLARAVLRLVPPREVEDIVQETYVRVCQIEQHGRTIEEPRAFLFKTARNLALDYLKRADTRLLVGMDDLSEPLPDTADPSLDQTFEEVATDEEFSLFCRAVRTLPLQCRRVFVMKKVYGYSQREIAQHFNLSENTVEKHIAEGIKRCMLFMHQHDSDYRRKTKGRNRAKVVNISAARGER